MPPSGLPQHSRRSVTAAAPPPQQRMRAAPTHPATVSPGTASAEACATRRSARRRAKDAAASAASRAAAGAFGSPQGGVEGRAGGAFRSTASVPSPRARRRSLRRWRRVQRPVAAVVADGRCWSGLVALAHPTRRWPRVGSPPQRLLLVPAVIPRLPCRPPTDPIHSTGHPPRHWSPPPRLPRRHVRLRLGHRPRLVVLLPPLVPPAPSS